MRLLKRASVHLIRKVRLNKMFSIDMQNRTPVWEQLVNQVEKYILLGILKPEDKLPSVRELAVQIGVNPNTINKAYAELSRNGVIVTAGGRGCFVDRNATDALRKKAEMRLPEFESITKELLLSGISKEELIKIIDKNRCV